MSSSSWCVSPAKKTFRNVKNHSNTDITYTYQNEHNCVATSSTGIVNIVRYFIRVQKSTFILGLSIRAISLDWSKKKRKKKLHNILAYDLPVLQEISS
jgi:hypothetical protein